MYFVFKKNCGKNNTYENIFRWHKFCIILEINQYFDYHEIYKTKDEKALLIKTFLKNFKKVFQLSLTALYMVNVF